jgi:uncharacterized RDD family membrane protein YckC
MPVPFPQAGLGRRLAALIYDSILLFGLWFVVTAMALPLKAWVAPAVHERLLTALLLGVGLLFHVWFWTHGGRTLGMQAWKIRLVREDGGPVGMRQALARGLAALPSYGFFGLGVLWMLVDREGLAWHDRWSATRVARDS